MNPDATIAGFRKYDVPEALIQQAVHNLLAADTPVLGVAVSGKLAAGKSTTAPLVLSSLGIPSSSQEEVYFAYTLKHEVDTIIRFIRENYESLNVVELARGIDQLQNTGLDNANQILAFLLPEFLIGSAPKNGWDKTPGNRRALQYWGTEIRRTQDENYFVKKAIANIAQHFANGKSVYVTDGRFENEIEALRAVGVKLVRIDVSREVQIQRLADRDGTVLTVEMENHLSETSLDNYPHFDVRFNTDNLTPEQAAAVAVSELRSA